MTEPKVSAKLTIDDSKIEVIKASPATKARMIALAILCAYRDEASLLTVTRRDLDDSIAWLEGLKTD